MKTFLKFLLAPIAATALLLGSTQPAAAHDDHRCNSHDGHYYHGRYYPNHYYYGGYRPYYGYGYGFPLAYGPAFSFSYYRTSPVYYGYSSPVYTAPAAYRDSVEVDVQLALKNKGYYRGVVDGDVGPATRSAIRSYQESHGLRVTGAIDDTLLRSLRV